MDRIQHNGAEIAVIIRRGSDASEFITAPVEPLQLGILKRSKGDAAPAHTHKFPPTIISALYEFLYVIKGRLRVSLYDSSSGDLIFKSEMVAGDMALLKAHAHGVEFLEESEIIEIKQGPYPGEENAKIYLDKLN